MGRSRAFDSCSTDVLIHWDQNSIAEYDMRKGKISTTGASPVFPDGSAYYEGAKFLQLEEKPVQFLEKEGVQYEVRWLGFGYFLCTVVGMAEKCGTKEEEGEPPMFGNGSAGCYAIEEWCEPPFIIRNTAEQMYNPFTKGIMEVV